MSGAKIRPAHAGARDGRGTNGASTPDIIPRGSLGADVPEFVPFPIDALPGPIREFVGAASAAIGCDPCYVALPLLSALAASVGNARRIGLKRSWSEPVILWTVLVGESGTLKTPAIKAALRPLRDAQRAAFAEHAAAMQHFEMDRLRAEAALTAWKREAARGTAPTEPPPIPAPPTARRYIVSDATTEALAPILVGNPRGVLLARDELAGWLGSFDRYSPAGRTGSDAPFWLSLHSGEAVTVDRKTGVPPTIHIPAACVSICGGIQPRTLARAIGVEHADNGLLARLLLAMPRRVPKVWREADIPAHADEALDRVFRTLLKLDFDYGPGNEPRPVILKLGPDGKRAWTEFYNSHSRETAALTGDLAAAWSKLEAAAARLAMVNHLARWAAGDPQVPRDSTPIDADSIRDGVRLARWFGSEARRVYSALAETDDDRKLKALVAWIRARGGSTTIRDLQRGGPREFREATAAGRALSELVGLGVGRWTATDRTRPGRPTDRFELADGPETDPPWRQNSVSCPENRIVSPVASVAKPTTPPGPDDGGPPIDALQDAADAALGERDFDLDGVDD